MVLHVVLSEDNKVQAMYGSPQQNTVEVQDNDERVIIFRQLISNREKAQAALQRSDTTILRCYENGVPVPLEWQQYRTALRGAANDGSASPPQPPYPEGT